MPCFTTRCATTGASCPTRRSASISANRRRGDDPRRHRFRPNEPCAPAKAGAHRPTAPSCACRRWVPAFAGTHAFPEGFIPRGNAPGDERMTGERSNIISPAGFAALRAEYDALLGDERPKLVETISWAAGNGDRSENGDYIYGRKRLREIDRRLAFLARRMKAARVVDPAQQPDRSRIRSEERREGKGVSVRVDLGGRRIIKKKRTKITNNKE